MKCWNCGFDNPPGAKFCSNCGQPQTKNCPNCNTPNPGGAKFCFNCGYNLQPATAAGAAPTSAPAAPSAPARPASFAGTLSAREAAPLREGLVEKLMPKELAQKMDAARTSRDVKGERRIVTILFCDVKGSTAMAEQLDPEAWADIMNNAFEYLIKPVHDYEGTVARLMGDAILAFFGAPIAHEDDPQRAILAGLDILKGIGEYRETIQHKYNMDFSVRVGLNTGLVVVGEIGPDYKYEYTAMGDAINVAARMQTAADPNTIFITENTYRQVSSLFDFEDKGLIEVKGKAEPVHVYRVLAAKKGAIKTRGIAGLSSPMVGRRREYSTLLQIADDVRAGHGSSVAVIGEAGLGKSRLIAEWRKAVLAETTDKPIRWVEGRCLSYGSSMAHHLSADVLRGLLGAPAGATEEETHTALKQTMQNLFGDEMKEVYPFLGHLLGVRLEDDMAARVKYLDGPALQAKYVAAYKRFLQKCAQSSPLIIVCEDIHWADPSSVELLTQVTPIVAEAPVVFAFITRPDKDAPGWKLITQAREIAGAGMTELHLAPLSEKDSQELVSNLLEIESLPENVRNLILAKAEGNPFFVEEVIRMLIDRGNLTRQDGQWIVAKPINTIDIPDTLQGVLIARIDRLPDDAKRVLQIASVIGRKFQVKVLEQVLAADQERTNA
ncbi:MAG TPA: adenylate/guanylate cyclase domain-containing protein [Anaerolineae bacterium]|nr:adenylate/guanylate cyclase domain-containing protein [Anaerolineae bacterium]